MSAMGVPVWTVSGNHDVNYASPDDLHSLETFKRTYGPPYYSFDYGQVHFVVLDNVEYQGRAAGAESARGGGGYRGYVDEKQLHWLSNDLRHVAQDRLVVICTHIPLSNSRTESDSIRTVNAPAVLQTLEGRDRVLLLAGHMHTTDHAYLTREEGWLGARPLHQHMLTAACGVWWRGASDDRGIPFSPLSDGGENGYHVYTFDGASYSSRFKAASRAESYQLRIAIDAEYKNDEYGGLAFSQLGQQGGILRSEQVPSTLLVANVFSAGERATVSLHLDGGPPQPMTRRLRTDPWYVELYERQAPTKQGQIRLSEPELSSHVWETRLPPDLTRGLHVARVEVTDQFGQVFQAVKIFEVVEP